MAIGFNNGDRVTGDPVTPEMIEKYGTITGYYELVPTEWMGKMYQMEFVVVGDAYVTCDNIREASRRDKDTVFTDD